MIQVVRRLTRRLTTPTPDEVSKFPSGVEEATAEDIALMTALGGELPVFLRFSKVMLAAQLLEFTIFQITHLKKKTPTDMERAIRKLEGLLKQPPRDAAKHIDLDPSLFSDLNLALEIRNLLAHEFLTRFRLEYVVREEKAVVMAKAFLDASIAFIADVQSRLDEVAEERLLERAIEAPYLDDDEMDDLMQSLKKWAEEDLPNLNG